MFPDHSDSPYRAVDCAAITQATLACDRRPHFSLDITGLDWATYSAEDSYQLPASAHHVDRSKELLLTRLCRCWGFLYRGPTVLGLSSGQYWLFTLGALLRPGPPAGRDSHCQQLERLAELREGALLQTLDLEQEGFDGRPTCVADER